MLDTIKTLLDLPISGIGTIDRDGVDVHVMRIETMHRLTDEAMAVDLETGGVYAGNSWALKYVVPKGNSVTLVVK